MDKPEKKRATGDLRKQIIEAALKIFGERGFERSTTKAIAREAGVAEGTIYNYFSTKKDILFSFLEQEVVTPLSGVLRDGGALDSEIIRNVLRNRLTMWRENRAVLKVMIAEGLFNEELAQEIRRRIFEPASKEVSSYIADRIESGTFRGLDPHVVALGLVGMIISFGLIEPTIGFGAETVDDAQIVETLASLILHGLESPGPNQ